MFCTRCGKPYLDNSRFCSQCGNQLQPPVSAPQQPINSLPVYPPVMPAQPVYYAQQPVYVQTAPVYAPIPISIDDVPLQSVAPPEPVEKGNPLVPILIIGLMGTFGLGAYVISHILEII